MAISQQAVYEYVSQNGPAVATKIASAIGSDSYITGAVLSELLESKRILITRSSAAGSPLYYVSGQEEKLVVLRDKLKEKDRNTFDLLRESGVIREDAVEPLTRVSLQNLPDFAIKIAIRLGEETVQFYKWFLLSNEEVIAILQKQYAPPKKEVPSQKEPETVSAQTTQTQHTLSEPSSFASSELLTGCTSTTDVISRLDSAGIRVSSSIEIKKNKESDCIIHIPTTFGVQKYFVKLLFKKKISETDLSTLFMQGSLKNLPICLMTNGSLTKKAEILARSDLDSVLIYHIN